MATAPDVAADPNRSLRVGLVGARGYTGAELVKLIDAHPRLTLAFALSRQAAGKTLQEATGAGGDLVVEDLDPAAALSRGVDALVLALPNGQSGPWLEALHAHRGGDRVVVVDLSADHRFDDAWVYGLPEHDDGRLRGAVRIANPGCYATGTQVALKALWHRLDGPAHVFGVSGYSGAGTTPSDKNDPNKLKDNLLPYALADHLHEREVSRHLGGRVYFSPHVAPFFRGITLTASFALKEPATALELLQDVSNFYERAPLVKVTDTAPLVRDAAYAHTVNVGGFSVDAAGRRAVVIATLDNLLKGAATQAVQNLNLGLGLDVHLGVPLA